MLVDTLKASKRLIKAGLSEDQAEAIIATVTDSREILATRADIELLESRLTVRLGGFAIALTSLAVAIIKLL